MKIRDFIFVFGVAFLFWCSCSKEESAADKRKEEQEREYRRLDEATGVYEGFIRRNEGNLVPASLIVGSKRNPVVQGLGEAPILSVVLRVGFFGGVNIESSMASYDYKAKRLVASFARAEGQALEFSGIVKSPALVNATLIGPNLGTMEMSLAKGVPTLFLNEVIEEEVYYALRFAQLGENAKSPIPDAVLTIKREEQKDQPALAEMDLPSLPPLSASLGFYAEAMTPDMASQVLYDPLQGAIQIFFHNSETKVEFGGVYLDEQYHLSGSSFSGEITAKSKTLTMVHADRIPQKNQPNLPPHAYVGILKGVKPWLQYKIIGKLQYLNSMGTNSSELPFSNYPDMELTVQACFGRSPIADFKDRLASVDHLNRKTRFTSVFPDKTIDLEVKYSANWKTLEGIARNLNAGTDFNGQDPQFELHAVKETGSIDCSFKE